MLNLTKKLLNEIHLRETETHLVSVSVSVSQPQILPFKPILHIINNALQIQIERESSKGIRQ